MVDAKLVDDLSQRAGVSRADAEAMLEALRALPLDRVLTLLRRPTPPPSPYAPGSLDVEALIARAERHPLGVDFLLNGDLSAVAATFQAHAFTVDAARLHLKGRE